jgi:hypothetical protein
LILFKSSDIYPCDVFERNIEQQNGPLAAAHFDIFPPFLLAVFYLLQKMFLVGKDKSLNLKNKTNKILGGNRFETRATHSEK